MLKNSYFHHFKRAQEIIYVFMVYDIVGEVTLGAFAHIFIVGKLQIVIDQNLGRGSKKNPVKAWFCVT